MIRALSPLKAVLLAILLLVAAGWSLTIAPLAASPAAPIAAAGQARAYSDVQLHQDIAARVAAGDGYYAAATTLQRAHGFPTRPFVTVRLPTLAVAAAWLGWPALHAVLAGLLFLAVLLWFRALDGVVTTAERIAVAGFVLLGGAMVASPGLTTQHELWAGVLLTIALACRVSGQWWWAVLAAAAALAIRELALPFVLLAGLFGLLARNRAETAAWAALTVLFAAGLALHAHAVALYALPTDLPSQGWNEARGMAAPLRDIVDVTLLNRLPAPLSYLLALLPLAGWLAAPPRLARFAVPLFLGYMVLLAAFARAQNFYWAIMLLPAYAAGFAFLPRLLQDLAHALLAGRRTGL